MNKSGKISMGNLSKLSRTHAEQILSNESNGSFLIRESEHYPGDLTLSIRDTNSIQHYRIKFDLITRSYTVDAETFFFDLDSLVEHYTRDADGLCCRLGKALFTKYDTIDTNKSQTVETNVTNSPPYVQITIDHKELQIGELVGSGEFAQVHEGIYKKSRVAIKTLKDPTLQVLFHCEANIMSSLKHRNLVQFIGLAMKPDNILCLVTEFMSKGSLLHYLTTRGRSVISQSDLISFSIDICEGLNYLEQNHIVHRDIAASNVLITDDNIAKISDFGLAKFLNVTGKENGDSYIREKIKCRTKWTAPEALEFNTYTHKSDMWSYGILLWEIFSYGRCPYPRIPANEVLTNLKEGYRMGPPNDCPTEIKNVMRDAWNMEPTRRPSFYQVLQRLK